MEGKIEMVTMDDLMDVLTLQKKAFESVAIAVNNMNIQPMIQTYEGIVEEYGRRRFLKYTENGVIIGSVRGHIDEDNICHVGKLIVHPDYQNKGIGTALIREIENHFNDCAAYEIFTSVNDKKTVYLYKKMGYVETCVKTTDNVPIVFLRKANQ